MFQIPNLYCLIYYQPVHTSVFFLTALFSLTFDTEGEVHNVPWSPVLSICFSLRNCTTGPYVENKASVSPFIEIIYLPYSHSSGEIFYISLSERGISMPRSWWLWRGLDVPSSEVLWSQRSISCKYALKMRDWNTWHSWILEACLCTARVGILGVAS